MISVRTIVDIRLRRSRKHTNNQSGLFSTSSRDISGELFSDDFYILFFLAKNTHQIKLNQVPYAVLNYYCEIIIHLIDKSILISPNYLDSADKLGSKLFSQVK